MDKPYKIKKSEIVFKGAVIDVAHDDITLPDGKISKREVILRGNASAVVPIDDNGDVILIKQYRHPALSIIFEIPAGMSEEGEDPKETAMRELEEETGIKAKELTHIITMYPAVGICTEKIYIYLGRELQEGTLNPDEDEFIEVVKMPLKEAIDKIYSHEILDSKTIAGLLACQRYL